MTDVKKLEDRLWEAADHLRANSALRLNEFAEPVLGLIFLKFADVKFIAAKKEIEVERVKATSKRQRSVAPEDYQSRGVLFIPEGAHFSYLISLPEGTNMGNAVNDAMKAIEAENKELAGILPKNYNLLENSAIISLLKNFNQIPDTIEGDAFGLIYEYFLGKFAIADGSGGGEFFTPTSIVKLIVEILEPFKGYIYDPACGSGGMFVQSVEFIKRHFENGKKLKAAREVSIYGQEKTDQTVRIAKMNLAIHGLPGDIRQGNTYYEDLHRSLGKFDFAMANPPFNVNGIDKERIKDDPRFPYGIPRNDNGNYLWIQIFLSALKNTGRAGFVMANSASDAGHSEKEIRAKMIDAALVDVMVAVGTNMFYNVGLPVTLWFLDKNKKKTDRKNKILFIDARGIYHQIDRAHRDWTEDQIQQIVDIVRTYRGEGAKKYKDVKGLCKVATLEEVRLNGYSLNPGVYTGAVEGLDKNELTFESGIKNIYEFSQEKSDINKVLNLKICDNLNKYYGKFKWNDVNFYSVEVLEQLIRLIYSEWFIRFNIPKRNLKMVNSGSEFGNIPDGWKVGKLQDLVEIIRSSTHSGDHLNARRYVPIDYIDSHKLTLSKFAPIQSAKSSLILFERGDILFGAMRPYFHKVAIAPFPGVTRTTCFVLRPKVDLGFAALTLFQKKVIDFATANSQGATIPYINWNNLSRMECIIPPKDIIREFSAIVEPVIELTHSLVILP